MPETPVSLASSVSAPPLQRNVRSVRLQAETQEKRGKKAEHSRGCYSVLFVAATQCYRVVAAWRRSSVPFLSLSLSLSLPSSLIHTDTLPCSVTCSLPRTRCMCAPRSAPSPSRPFPPPTGSSQSEYWYLNVLRQLTVEINHGCKAEPRLAVSRIHLRTISKMDLLKKTDFIVKHKRLQRETKRVLNPICLQQKVCLVVIYNLDLQSVVL